MGDLDSIWRRRINNMFVDSKGDFSVDIKATYRERGASSGSRVPSKVIDYQNTVYAFEARQRLIE